jgi:hypothetical protein
MYTNGYHLCTACFAGTYIFHTIVLNLNLTLYYVAKKATHQQIFVITYLFYNLEKIHVDVWPSDMWLCGS